MTITQQTTRTRREGDRGYSLVELVISMGIMTVVMGATMAGLADVSRGNEAVLNMADLSRSLRAGMDLMVRDMLQVGSGLPPGHVITIPHGAGSALVNLPGPVGSAFATRAADTDIAAVFPRPGGGPTINGVPTDVVTVLTADNTFLDVGLTAVTASSVDIALGLVLDTGPDRVTEGQLMMISKGSFTTLVQVTTVDYAARRLKFDDGDSLNLNQSGAADGTLGSLNAEAPANTPSSTRITRIRMMTYYLDNTIDPQHPRLVRRINNGHPTTFDNSLGTAVAMDIENLQVTYDLNDGATNPGNVRMTAADLGTGGACAPSACSENQVRKMNIAMTGRSRNASNRSAKVYRNTLSSQVSLRGMAFVDRYRQP